jgi:hypothetical protein
LSGTAEEKVEDAGGSTGLTGAGERRAEETDNDTDADDNDNS